MSFQRSVKKIISTHHFDLIQSHERLTGVDIYRLGDGIHAAWVDRIKNISPWYKRYGLTLIHTTKELFKSKKKCLRTIIFYVANSELVKKELSEYYKVPKSRIRVIENGIDIKSFRLASASKKNRPRKISVGSNLTCGPFVGSGFERKGAFELVKAIKLLPKFQAIIVGQDKKIQQIKDLARGQKILIAGPQDNIQQYLDASDIFCLPSLYDSLPNAALEALCCGLPIVLTKDVGLAPHIEKILPASFARRTDIVLRML